MLFSGPTLTDCWFKTLRFVLTAQRRPPCGSRRRCAGWPVPLHKVLFPLLLGPLALLVERGMDAGSLAPSLKTLNDNVAMHISRLCRPDGRGLHLFRTCPHIAGSLATLLPFENDYSLIQVIHSGFLLLFYLLPDECESILHALAADSLLTKSRHTPLLCNPPESLL